MGTFRGHAVVKLGMLWWHWTGLSTLHLVTSPPSAAFSPSLPWCNKTSHFEICSLYSWLLLVLSLLLQMCLLNPPGSSGTALLTPQKPTAARYHLHCWGWMGCHLPLVQSPWPSELISAAVFGDSCSLRLVSHPA